MEKLRICLYGGPGIGKSTLAAYVAANLKMKHQKVELVDEFVKGWAYEGKRPKDWDQFLVFASQLHKEAFLFRHGINTIVTDSPVLQQCAYMNGLPFQYQLINVARDFDKQFPAIHVIIKREEFSYSSVGRFQNQKEAIDIDTEIDIMVRAYAIGPIWETKFSEKDKLVERLLKSLDRLEK